MLQTLKYFLSRVYTIISIVLFALSYGAIQAYAVYYPTDNITNPSCAPGDSGCYVSLFPQVGGRSIIYLPDQTNFSGTVYIGSNGGSNLLHSSSTQGYQNTFVGINSGNANTTAFDNTGIGYNALASTTTGFRNTAVGSGALASSTTANFSTAVGERALTLDNAGSNSAFGFFSGGNNLTGSSNNSFGRQSLSTNTAGSANNAFGNFSLGNITGSYNTGFGDQTIKGSAGLSSLTGNSAFGYIAGLNLITAGDYNSLFGYQAGSGITTGANNIILGARTLGSSGSGLTTGSNNILIGFNAGFNTAGGNLGTGSGNVIIGNAFTSYNIPSALTNTILLSDGAGTLRMFSNNVGTIIGNITTAATTPPNSTLDVYGKLSLNGRTAMYYPATSTFANTIFIGNGGSNLTSTVFGDGQLNTAVGIDSMLDITTGYGNTAMGNESMQAVTTGSVSAAFGSHALLNWQTGTDNAAFGVDTLHDLTNASFNSGFGTSVFYTTTTGTHNAGFGVDTFYYNLTGNYNTGMGNNAGKSMTSGDYNTFMGFLSAAGSSGSFTSTGSTAFGTSSLQYLSTGGNYNTAIGMNAGLNNTSGTINTYLGYNTGLGITTGSKNTIIGANVTGLSSSLSNNIIIADGDGNQRINVDSSGRVGIGTSTPNSLTTLHVSSSDSDHMFGAGGVTGFYRYGGNLPINTYSSLGTKASPTQHTTESVIGRYTVNAFNNGTTFTSVSRIAVSASENHTTTALGTSVRFEKTMNGLNGMSSYLFVDGLNNVGIGVNQVTPLYTLHVGSSSVTGIVSRFQNSTGTCDINPTTTSLSCSSDINLKKNIITLKDNQSFVLNTQTPETSILKNLNKITPVIYNWTTEQDIDTKHPGFIAQDVEQIFPSLVSTDPTTNLKSLNYIGLIPYAIEGIRELDIKVNQLSSLDTIDPLSLGSLIERFLGDAMNPVKNIFVKKIRVEEICVDEQNCLTKDDIKTLIQNLHSNQNSNPAPVVENIENNNQPEVIVDDTPIETSEDFSVVEN